MFSSLRLMLIGSIPGQIELCAAWQSTHVLAITTGVLIRITLRLETQWEHACCLHLLDLSSAALIPFLVHVHTAVPSLSSPSCDCSSSIKSCSMRSLL